MLKSDLSIKGLLPYISCKDEEKDEILDRLNQVRTLSREEGYIEGLEKAIELIQSDEDKSRIYQYLYEIQEL